MVVRSGLAGRPGAVALGVALSALLLCGAGRSAAAATVAVRVDGLVPGSGRLYVSLCSGSLEPAACGLAQSAAVTGPALDVTFPDVAPGTYAVAAFEDLNGNMVLDRSPHGLPLEPYAFSNNAGRRGTPRFEAAAIAIRADTVVVLHLSQIAGRR